MNHDIEWLFEEVYKAKKNNQKDPYFISDWDVRGEDLAEFKKILINVYENAGYNSLKYNYAYEQFVLKNQIINSVKQDSTLVLSENEITITPSSTISIFLAAQALVELSVKRILIITPAYFSLHESFDKAGCNVFYYHLKDNENLSIDFSKLASLIKEQFIEGIILTDPVYSAGIEFSLDDYNQLAKLCSENDIYFVVDYSLGGLQWDKKDNFVLNTEKVSIIKKCNKYLFIDTLSKRLLVNGIKFSIIIGDEDVIDKIDRISETVYGGLSSAQCLLIYDLYKPENSAMITNLCEANINKARSNYNLVKSFLIGSNYNLVGTNSGYFSLVNHNVFSLAEVDTKEFAIHLLKSQSILCIPKDRFTFYSDNSFGFRINLTKEKDELIPLLKKCIETNIKKNN